MKESFEINLFTHELQYRPVKLTSLSYRSDARTPSLSTLEKVTTPKIVITKSSNDNLGFDEVTIRMILKVQKVMRGHLWRKKYNFFDMKYYKVLFSKSFMKDKHVINLRIMERIYKDNPPKTPDRIIIAHDFTDKVRYNTLRYNTKVLGPGAPAELPVNLLLESITFNTKTHVMEYKGIAEEKPLPRRTRNLS